MEDGEGEDGRWELDGSRKEEEGSWLKVEGKRLDGRWMEGGWKLIGNWMEVEWKLDEVG